MTDARGNSRGAAALIVIDMLNPYEHDDAEPLAASVETVVAPLHGLIEQARASDVEVIWVNDQYDDFAATRADLVRRALDGRRPDLVEPLLPPKDCAFLQKARHSAFYGTSLEYLLRRHAIDRLILTGQVTEQCVLYSALDAYVRHYEICVVRDAVAHIDPQLGAAALTMMERNMRADVVDAAAALEPS